MIGNILKAFENLFKIFAPLEQYLIVFLDARTNFPWCEYYIVYICLIIGITTGVWYFNKFRYKAVGV